MLKEGEDFMGLFDINDEKIKPLYHRAWLEKKKLLLIAALLFSVLMLVSCGKPKTAISDANFKKAMDKLGFYMEDAAYQFEEGEVESVTLASNGDYQIEFYVLPSAEQAKSAFLHNKSIFEEDAGNISSHFSASLENYNIYTQASNNKYYAVSTVDNTMMYCVADLDYKAEITAIIKEFGYL